MKKQIRKLNKFVKNTIDSYRIGRGPVGVIDVGSIGGLQEPWSMHVSEVNYLLNFEPNDRPARKKRICTYNTALWEVKADLPFYIYKGFNATGSSLFEQNIDYVESNWDSIKNRGPRNLANSWRDRSQLVETLTLKCQTLDHVLSEEGIANELHFLKIDAQGAEMNILKGGLNFLSTQCVGLQLELFEIPLYKGIALKPEVVQFLSDLGFNLVLEMPAHGSFDSQNDCVFLHSYRGESAVRKAIMRVYGVSQIDR